MSNLATNPSQPLTDLIIQAHGPGEEITLIDGRFHVLAQGVSQVRHAVPPA